MSAKYTAVYLGDKLRSPCSEYYLMRMLVFGAKGAARLVLSAGRTLNIIKKNTQLVPFQSHRGFNL